MVQLRYFHDAVTPVLVASNYGGAKNPQWYYNLTANPDCEFGGDRFVALEVTDPDEYDRLFALAEQAYAGYGDYRAKTDPIGCRIPVFPVDASIVQRPMPMVTFALVHGGYHGAWCWEKLTRVRQHPSRPRFGVANLRP